MAVLDTGRKKNVATQMGLWGLVGTFEWRRR